MDSNEKKRKPQILLTNDDGIESPGLWAAAEALSSIGFVHVVAPRDQYSGAGRSLPVSSDGIIQSKYIQVNSHEWTVHAVGGTPAQAVLHALLEVMPQRPDLVVSGINYGENVGSGITVSGTVGAALEAASMGIPALAVSLETDPEHHLSYSTTVDFAAAAHFAVVFGKLLLSRALPEDVHVLKVDVPAEATPATPWAMTRLSRMRYYEPVAPRREGFEEPGKIGYMLHGDPREDDPDSDVYAIRVKKVISVTPLSLDMTARVSLQELGQQLKMDLEQVEAAPINSDLDE